MLMVGEEEVIEKFKDVYAALYNSAESSEEMSELLTIVTAAIIDNSEEEVRKVSGDKVKEAVSC